MSAFAALMNRHISTNCLLCWLAGLLTLSSGSKDFPQARDVQEQRRQSNLRIECVMSRRTCSGYARFLAEHAATASASDGDGVYRATRLSTNCSRASIVHYSGELPYRFNKVLVVSRHVPAEPYHSTPCSGGTFIFDSSP